MDQDFLDRQFVSRVSYKFMGCTHEGEVKISFLLFYIIKKLDFS